MNENTVMRIQTTIEINAAPEQVWEVMSDVERWPEWTASIESVQLLNGDFGLGARARVKQPKIPAAVWTVTQLTPNQGFVWTSSVTGVETVAMHAIEPTANGSRVSLVVEQKGFIVNVIPWIRSMGQRYIEMEAAGLKQRSEALVPIH